MAARRAETNCVLQKKEAHNVYQYTFSTVPSLLKSSDIVKEREEEQNFLHNYDMMDIWFYKLFTALEATLIGLNGDWMPKLWLNQLQDTKETKIL